MVFCLFSAPMLRYYLFSLKKRNLQIKSAEWVQWLCSGRTSLSPHPSNSPQLCINTEIKGLHTGRNIKHCNFSWGFAGSDYKNLICPVNLALKKNWVPHFSVGDLWDHHISHSWLSGFLAGFVSTYYFLPVTIMSIMRTHPFLLKRKPKTSVLCEEDTERWWLLSVNETANFENPSNSSTCLNCTFLPCIHAAWLQVTGPGRSTLPKGNKDITNQIFPLITHKYLNLAWRVIFRRRLILQIITILLVKTLNHKNQWRMCDILPLCVEINFFCNTNLFSLTLAHGERCRWVKFYPQKHICNTYRNQTQACKNTIWLTGQNFLLFKALLTCGRRRHKIAFYLSEQGIKKNDFAGS